MKSPYFFLSPLLALAALPANAVDLTWSGFGTLGYARSDQSYRYQRFIDSQGTFNADSLLGVQMNAVITPQWRASVQATLTPSTSSDSRWEGTASWAFLSYRYSNDLLLRFGKLRVPMYLNSENMNVGATFDFMRLPTEVYTTAPTTDFTGAAFSKTWDLGNADLGLDGYWGKAKIHNRMVINQETLFASMKTESAGLVLTLRRDEDVYRAGIHQTRTEPTDSGTGRPALPPGVVDIAPGPEKHEITAPVFTVGADIAWGQGFRSVGEVALRNVKQAEDSRDTWGAYVSLQKTIGPWTPYLTYSRLHSGNIAPHDESHESGSVSSADSLGAFDQSAWALGTSYALTPKSKIKGEWMRVKIGDSSTLVDPPAGGGSVSGQSIHIFSLSYNFVF